MGFDKYACALMFVSSQWYYAMYYSCNVDISFYFTYLIIHNSLGALSHLITHLDIYILIVTL
jgi:hypothetical protein